MELYTGQGSLYYRRELLLLLLQMVQDKIFTVINHSWKQPAHSATIASCLLMGWRTVVHKGPQPTQWRIQGGGRTKSAPPPKGPPTQIPNS